MKDAILSMAALGLVILLSFSFAGNNNPYYGSFKPAHKSFAALQHNFNINGLSAAADSPVLPKPDTLPKPVPIPKPDSIPVPPVR